MVRTFQQLYFDQLRDLHSMETLIGPSLDRIAGWAHSTEHASMLRARAAKTSQRIVAIKAIFARGEEALGNDQSKAIQGLNAGGEAHVASAGMPARDAMIVAHALRVGTYSCATYRVVEQLSLNISKLDTNLLVMFKEEDKQWIDGLIGFLGAMLKHREAYGREGPATPRNL